MLRQSLAIAFLLPTLAAAQWTDHGIVQELCMGVDYADPWNGWTAGGKDGIGPRINKFENAGANWYNQSSEMLNMMWLDVDMANTQVGFASGLAAFLFTGSVGMTADGGNTWVSAWDESAVAAFPDLQTLDSETVVVGGMWTYLMQERQGFIVSTDRGSTWVRRKWNVPEWVSGLWFQDKDYGFLAGGTWPTEEAQAKFRNAHHPRVVLGDEGAADEPFKAVILRTEDGGNTFSKVFERDGFTASKPHFINRHEGWVACFWDDGLAYKGKILHTTDAGANWEEQNIPSADYANVNDVRFFNRREGWAIGFRTGAFTIRSVALHTTDGGQTWTEDPFSVNIGPIDFAWLNEGQGWYTGANDLQYSRMIQFLDVDRIPVIELDQSGYPDSAQPGQTISWDVQATNVSNQTQSGAVWLSITGPSLPAPLSPYLLPLAANVSLPAGSSGNGNVTLTIPPGTPRGEYDLELLIGTDRSENPRKILGYDQFMLAVR